MPATLANRYALASNATFRQRVAAACWSVANTVGGEVLAEQSDRAQRRIDLVLDVLQQPDLVGDQFARAAAGWNPATPATDIADTYADATGTDDQKVAAITDAQILSYVTGAWNAIAGVRPWERS